MQIILLGAELCDYRIPYDWHNSGLLRSGHLVRKSFCGKATPASCRCSMSTSHRNRSGECPNTGEILPIRLEMWALRASRAKTGTAVLQQSAWRLCGYVTWQREVNILTALSESSWKSLNLTARPSSHDVYSRVNAVCNVNAGK